MIFFWLLLTEQTYVITANYRRDCFHLEPYFLLV
jgi:hypothetical protein